MVAADNYCTTTQYAPANTSENLVGLVSSTEKDNVACPGYAAGSVTSVPDGLNTLTAPAGVTATEVGSATETFYDDLSFSTTFPQTTTPTTGNASLTRTAVSGTPGSFTWQAGNEEAYDDYGRATSSTSPLNYVTTTAYTMNSAGLTTGQTVTSPPTTYNNGGTPVTTPHVSLPYGPTASMPPTPAARTSPTSLRPSG